MKRILIALGIVASVGATARADFIVNGTSLPTTKVDLLPLPSRANPINYIVASDYNALTSALVDTRNAITQGSYLGFSAQASAPAPINATNFLWFKNDNTLHFKYGATDINLTSPATLLTTKGDLLTYGTGLSRLGVGADTQVLIADSTQALGVRWGAITTTLQQAYNNGAAASETILNLDSVRNGIQIRDATSLTTLYLFRVSNGTNANYLDVENDAQSKTNDPFSYPGIHVWQHINASNLNTLFIGDDVTTTTDLQLGGTYKTTTGNSVLNPVDVQVANKLGIGRAPNNWGLVVHGGGAHVEQYADPAPVLSIVSDGTSTPYDKTYTYYIVAKDPAGYPVQSSTVTTAAGPSGLSGANHIHLTWTAVGSAARYDVIRSASTGSPPSTGSIALGITATTFDDTGYIASTYSPPGRNSTGDLLVDGSITSSDGMTTTGTTTLNGATRINVNGVGTSELSPYGLSVTNTTAAVNNGQQYSPIIEQVGQGWNSTAAASQAVKFGWQAVPVQQAGTPTGNLDLYFSSNGAAYGAAIATFGSTGIFTSQGSIVSGFNFYTGSGGNFLAQAGSGLDTAAAGTLNIGVGNATSIAVAKTGITTTVGGNLVQTQGAYTSGSPTALTVTAGAHTTLAASTEDIGANFNFSATKQFATGNITAQREVLFQVPTYSFVGASTITNAATLAISGAPIAGANATITNSYALWIQGGASRFDGGALIAAGQGVDTVGAGALVFGGTTATSVQIGGSAAGGINFNTSGGQQWNLNSSGTIYPQSDNSKQIGSNSFRVASVYAENIKSGDAAAADAGGSALLLSSQQGGPGSATAGGGGGNLNVVAANGGAGTVGNLNGGNGGSVTISSGSGGVGAGTGTAGAAGSIAFQIGGTSRWQISTSGTLYPSLDNATDFGADTLRPATVYAHNVSSSHFDGSGTAPTVAVGTATQLGTGPAAAVAAGTDAAGTVTFTSGTAPAAFVGGAEIKIATLTFNAAYATTAPRGIVVTPANNNSAQAMSGTTGIQWYAKQSTTSTGTFDIYAIDSGAGSFVASTAYALAYVVIQ